MTYLELAKRIRHLVAISLDLDVYGAELPKR